MYFLDALPIRRKLTLGSPWSRLAHIFMALQWRLGPSMGMVVTVGGVPVLEPPCLGWWILEASLLVHPRPLLDRSVIWMYAHVIHCLIDVFF